MQTFDKTLKIHQVQQITGLCRNEITQKINAGTFPKPFKRNVWLKSHIDDWLQNQTEPAPQKELKNFDFQNLEIFFRRLILVIQIGKLAYSYIKSEIVNASL
jgi:predicted DNA-binding transcriptional regulator AlpA